MKRIEFHMSLATTVYKFFGGSAANRSISSAYQNQLSCTHGTLLLAARSLRAILAVMMSRHLQMRQRVP